MTDYHWGIKTAGKPVFLIGDRDRAQELLDINPGYKLVRVKVTTTWRPDGVLFDVQVSDP